MSDVIVYDDTSAAAAGTDELNNGAAFSFTTSGAASGSLVDVKLEMMDKTAATDGGYVAVSLYNNAAGTNAPGKQIAYLGTVNDSELNPNGSGTLVDIPLAASATLTPGTRYWINVSLVGGSNATLNFEGPTSGTGVTGEYFEAGGMPNSNSPGGAEIGQITEEIVCFATGTRIRTTRGDCAVENLAVGDLVVTASGVHRPIRWLGHRVTDCRRDPAATQPIRIAAHAFGENRPARDLFVSPGHAICVDLLGEVLIPAGLLVNGTTIAQVEVASLTYWHVEFDSHDVILAEGLPAESYLEMGNRPFFAKSDLVALRAGPDARVRTHADFCRPFVDGGPVLEAVKAQLENRAIKHVASAHHKGAAVA